MEKKSYSLGQHKATLYISEDEDRPFIVLNNYSGDGDSVVKALKEIQAPACNLLVVSNLNWDDDMTPWPCPPISSGDNPCMGKADAYLKILISEILPKGKSMIRGIPSFIGIAGYSLAGLFALYTMYNCDVFERVACVSGSLWYPDFAEYVSKNEFNRRPDIIYMSLGDKEAHTKNPYLCTVMEQSERIVEQYKKQGLMAEWEINPGNHFTKPALRTAKGISAIAKY